MGIEENCNNEASASSVASEHDGGDGDEETDPDMLKNTPSNIRRLEDEIEQCEGRQKYLAQTRSPSDGGDLRWYFCKLPLKLNELAASVPCAEVVGKGEYFRFGMRDSLAIEASFLQREEELLSYWWKEYAECSEGPKGRPSLSTEADLQRSSQSSELYTVDEERVGVAVKGGLYEVDLLKRHSFPVYWNGENRRVLRGHWFAQSGGLDWLPIREDVTEQLEFAYRRQVWHRRTFQPSGLFAARVDLQGSTPGLHALFTGEDDTWEAWLNVDASGFIKFGGKGVKLRRGYAASSSPKPTQDELRQQKEEEMDDYCSQVPVRHLVFMVHGIGQRLEKSNLVDDVTNFRRITSILAEKHLSSYQRGSQRVLFIPCQWRKGLKLSGESAVEKITLDGVRGLRTMLSATVHDVLYYMSPIHCQDIVDSVSNQLNRLYLKFMKRNPGYDGKVSLYGHSLGSVLSYDILCHQENLSSPFPMDCMYREHISENISSDSAVASSQLNRHDGTEGSLEDLSYRESGRHNLQEFSENEHSDDPRSVMDVSATSFSVREESSFEERENEVQEGDTSTPGDGEHQLSNPWAVISAGVAVSNDVGPPDCDMKDDVGQATGSHGAAEPQCAENVFDESSEITDKDKMVTDLKLEVNSLKARLAELEAQVGRADTCVTHELHSGTPDQEDSRKTASQSNDSSNIYKPLIKYTKLEFKVDTFFAVGSPLGVFLSLRNVRMGIGEGKEYWDEGNITEEMPACQQMFNVFHPFDPVAYRVEPLVCKEYISKRPVIIPYHKGGKRLHIGLQEFSEDLAARSQSIKNQLYSIRVKVLTVCQSNKNECHEDAEDVFEEKRSYGSYMMERLTGSEEGRIDHVLQDKTFQHSYISAIGAHTNYWRDFDTALFILKHLYRNVPEAPAQSNMYRRILKDDVSPDLSNTKGSLEEELPLTFSDGSLIRTYSKKTNKVEKKSWW